MSGNIEEWIRLDETAYPGKTISKEVGRNSRYYSAVERTCGCVQFFSFALEKRCESDLKRLNEWNENT